MQGFNMGRYVPPDVEGTTSANKLHKKHALGQRASKLASHGILTVRFEMPFPIWCGTCPEPVIIGQGVRFNAEKKKIGNYLSSPVWSFRFRHPACGGTIEMRTDPKNTAYVVAEGATKREAPAGCEAVVLTGPEREALRKNAFASLEKTIGDRERLLLAGRRIESLRDAQDRAWEDPYAINQKLRRAFRVGRREREREEVAGRALRDRMGWGIELLPLTEEDAQRAGLVDFGTRLNGQDLEVALAKPLFGGGGGGGASNDQNGGDVNLKPENHAARQFVSALMSNSRAVHDPFLQQKRHASPLKTPKKVQGAKRKRGLEKTQPVSRKGPAKMALVEYDSD